MVSGNIKSGVKIFNVTGSLAPASIGTLSSEYDLTSMTGITNKYYSGEYVSYTLLNGSTSVSTSSAISGLAIFRQTGYVSGVNVIWVFGSWKYTASSTSAAYPTTTSSLSYVASSPINSLISGYETGTGITFTISSDKKTLSITVDGYASN